MNERDKTRHEIDRMVDICKRNNWPLPKFEWHDSNEVILSMLRSIVASRSHGKRMRDDGVYFG